ncbi:hypothetical protein CVT26_008422 [Gymnopilus dilepis]|uniref:Uncharacterized protein n=1 Tax=Gymnopilus dilepis TaxID=231916 RepID=A0A409YFT2_9AGAR|nr:hypothetical protein CVT26_008422 [Gymnopilus dilepis]
MDADAQESSRGHTSEDSSDVRTLHGQELEAKIDTSIFDVFTDFELDLSCLSTPPSPVASTSELPPPTPSPPSSPVLQRTASYTSQLSSLTKKLPTKKSLSHKASSTTQTQAAPRGSWPLVKYAGRGTPVDRNRRLEWGGFSAEAVGEDGVLSSHIRSTSLDSGVHPSHRSLSPEWNYLPRLSSSSSHSGTTTPRRSSVEEQPPELAPLQIEAKDDEWDTIMKTVLSPTVESSEPVDPADPAEDEDRGEDRTESKSDSERATENTDPSNIPSDTPTMSPEQIEQLDTGLEINLGLDAALDLGLGQRGGMNWFNLGLLPTSASGRDSPSVYSSQAQTPQASRPASIHLSEHRSTNSTKAERYPRTNVKSDSPRWWTKLFNHMRRVQTLITIHKGRF